MRHVIIGIVEIILGSFGLLFASVVALRFEPSGEAARAIGYFSIPTVIALFSIAWIWGGLRRLQKSKQSNSN